MPRESTTGTTSGRPTCALASWRSGGRISRSEASSFRGPTRQTRSSASTSSRGGRPACRIRRTSMRERCLKGSRETT